MQNFFHFFLSLILLPLVKLEALLLYCHPHWPKELWPFPFHWSTKADELNPACNLQPLATSPNTCANTGTTALSTLGRKRTCQSGPANLSFAWLAGLGIVATVFWHCTGTTIIDGPFTQWFAHNKPPALTTSTVSINQSFINPCIIFLPERCDLRGNEGFSRARFLAVLLMGLTRMRWCTTVRILLVARKKFPPQEDHCAGAVMLFFLRLHALAFTATSCVSC